MHRTIDKIVKEDFRTAPVFEKYGLCFETNIGLSLVDICKEKQLDIEKLAAELEESRNPIVISRHLAYHSWSLTFLVNYIENVHHAYVAEAIPKLEGKLSVFYERHQNNFPFVADVISCVKNMGKVLKSHNAHEEDVIFPYIRHLEHLHKKEDSFGKLFIKTLRKPLEDIQKYHNEIDTIIESLDSIYKSYKHSGDSNLCMNVLFYQIQEIQHDINQHHNLENNILFPRALAIENEILN